AVAEGWDWNWLVGASAVPVVTTAGTAPIEPEREVASAAWAGAANMDASKRAAAAKPPARNTPNIQSQFTAVRLIPGGCRMHPGTGPPTGGRPALTRCRAPRKCWLRDSPDGAVSQLTEAESPLNGWSRGMKRGNQDVNLCYRPCSLA